MTNYDDADERDAERHELAADAAFDDHWDRYSFACGACGQMIVLVDGDELDNDASKHDCARAHDDDSDDELDPHADARALIEDIQRSNPRSSR